MGVASGHPREQGPASPCSNRSPRHTRGIALQEESTGWRERGGEKQFLSSPQFLKTAHWQKQLGKQILPPRWYYGIGPPEYLSLPCATRPPTPAPAAVLGREGRSLDTSPMPGTGEGAPLCKTPTPRAVSHVLMCRGHFPIGNPHLGFIPRTSPVSTGAQARWLLTQCQKSHRFRGARPKLPRKMSGAKAGPILLEPSAGEMKPVGQITLGSCSPLSPNWFWDPPTCPPAQLHGSRLTLRCWD